jgi:hypothetical protein
MKILAASTLFAAVASAQDSGDMKKEYEDSVVQSLDLVSDEKSQGTLKWFTRTYHKMDDKVNVTQVHYHCMPTLEGGAGYAWADYNNNEISCQIGVVSGPGSKNMADICRMKIRVKHDDGGKIEWTENEDGQLKGYDQRPADQKHNMDGEGQKECTKNEEVTALGKNDTIFMPTIAWMKNQDTGDANDDIVMDFATNFTFAW